MGVPQWCSPSQKGVEIRVHIQPKAGRTEVTGPFGEPLRLKIRVAAPPVDGAANEALIEFLAKQLRIPKFQIEILRGEKGRKKDLLCRGVSVEAVLSLETKGE